MNQVVDIDPRAHGFKIDEGGKVASSEAELANKRIDAKIPEFEEEIDHDIPHDKEEVVEEVYKESLSKDRSDRLGLVRPPDKNMKERYSETKTGLKESQNLDLTSEPKELKNQKEELGKAKWEAWWAEYKESGAIESMKEEYRKKARQEREKQLELGVKTCSICNEELPVSLFQMKKRTRKDGTRYRSLSSMCKKCKNNKNAEYRASPQGKDVIRTYRQSPEGKARAKRESALRKRRNRKATPKWLTKEQKQQIVDTYELMRDCRTITGEDYHVDHIVPLRGENICGLHVPWNLQVLPAYVNINKSNQYV